MPHYSDNNTGFSKGMDYQEWVRQQYPLVYPKRKLSFFEGKMEQLRGETREGIEIKLDDLIFEYCDEGRIYIETHEKAQVQNAKYVESGIYRNDNTRIWLVGDYSMWFLFSKAKLVWLDKLDPPFLYRPKPTGTSIGFCIPLPNAKRLCLDFRSFPAESLPDLKGEHKMGHQLPKADRQRHAAEAALLGAMIINPQSIADVREYLVDYTFADERFGLIYEAIIAVWATQPEMDVLRVRDELTRRGHIRRVKIETLAMVLDAVPAAGHHMSYVDRLLQQQE